MNDLHLLFLIVLYTLAVSNSFRALSLRHSPSSTLAWILINLGFPFVGVPLFFLLGQNRIRGYVRKKIKRDKESHSDTTHNPPIPEIPSNQSTNMKTFVNIFSQYDSVFHPTLNHVKLLIDGEQTFRAIFKAIDQANHYIFISYYILRSDRIGVELKDLLIKKAKQGIEIYLLLDDMGSFWISRKFIRELRKAGVNVSRFLPVFSLSRVFFINFRNHRKLVTVDSKVAFTGGLNVGDEYIGKKNTSAYWRDTHLQLNGPSVKKLESIFISDWEFSTNEPGRSKPYQTSISFSQSIWKDIGPYQQFHCQVIPTGPTDNELLGLFLFMQTITSAKKRLWIATPYLIPDTQIINQLQLACLRGVDVRILIPKHAANWFLNQISLYYAHQIYLQGGKIYQYSNGFMHQKIVLIDDDMTMTGSSNLDHRTIYLNFETNVLIFDKTFNQSTAEMMKEDLLSSKFNSDDIVRPILLLKLLRSALRLTAPLL